MEAKAREVYQRTLVGLLWLVSLQRSPVFCRALLPKRPMIEGRVRNGSERISSCTCAL